MSADSPGSAEPEAVSALPSSAQENTFAGYVREYIARVRGGDIGALPAVLGLAIAVIIFAIANDRFASQYNFANLFQQGAQFTLTAMGLIFVLLLGEIDLSAGFTGGVAATIMAVLLTDHGWTWYWSIIVALLVGVVIGLFLGFVVAKIRVPSFVVTLAMFLALQGVQLLFLSGGTAISIADSNILAINGRSMPVWLGWVLYGVTVAGFAAIQFVRAIGRRRHGLVPQPLSVILARIGAVAIIGGLAVYALNAERGPNPAVTSLKGVPYIVPIILVLLIVLSFLTTRTRYGRHLYAVGGNAEAARRAGIKVDSIRISAFVFCSTLAALGGIVAASRNSGVDPNLGGSTVLLYSVGAAVIGGTSLMGGRGRILDAVVGGALIAVIDNGLGLVGFNAGEKYIATGVVLLIAATVDAVSRRRAAATGH